jgi:hypothetical protein
MALRKLTVIEKNKLVNYSDFVGTVEMAVREKAKVFIGIGMDDALPNWIANRTEQSKLRSVSKSIRDGGYTPLELAKKFLAKHDLNIDDTNTTVDQLTTYILSQNQFDTVSDQMIREEILKIEA